jgi:hypothetical protein
MNALPPLTGPVAPSRRPSRLCDPVLKQRHLPPHPTPHPQVCMSHSMSTKGAAALRLRSTTLRQTGYLEGVMGMPGATPAHLPSA